MAYADLREFINRLDAAGALRRITAEVSCELELAEIATRVMHSGGPALLFENVTGYDRPPGGPAPPVLINHFGSPRRMAWALGAEDLEEVASRIRDLIEREPPRTLGEKLRLGGQLVRLASWMPKTVSSAPCQEVVQEPSDLRRWPILKCWPQDGGPFVTLPMVFTKHPQTGRRNVGMYRMQVYDERTTGMHWHRHKVGAMHYAAHERAGMRMPVAVALGGDPAITYAATAPMPEDVDEMLLAGFLRQRPVELVRCRTCDLEVPADAEMVIEGYVDPGERRLEGPFGDHTGYYSAPDEYPVFHVTAITHRRDPIYPATVVGPPPMEDCHMAKATERLFLPLLRLVLPELVDLNLPVVGVFHNLAIVSIRKAYPGHARKVMNALWGAGQLMFTKVVLVVDENVDVHDTAQVAWRALNAIDPRRDVVFGEGPVDALDHASADPFVGSKMGIDATDKWPEELGGRQWPEQMRSDPEVKARVDALWEKLSLPACGEG